MNTLANNARSLWIFTAQPGNSDTTPSSASEREPRLADASNDNYSCIEQYLFERAVLRELSGDVDF